MAKTVTKTYESVFIVDSLFEEDKVDSIIQKYTDLLTKEGCSIDKIDKWGRRKLAYSIKRKTSGYYITIEFTGPTKVISRLERAYHLDDNILRFLNVSFDKKTYALRNEYLIKMEEIESKREAELSALEEEIEFSEEDLEDITPDAENPTENVNQDNSEGKEDQQA